MKPPTIWVSDDYYQWRVWFWDSVRRDVISRRSRICLLNYVHHLYWLRRCSLSYLYLICCYKSGGYVYLSSTVSLNDLIRQRNSTAFHSRPITSVRNKNIAQRSRRCETCTALSYSDCWKIWRSYLLKRCVCTVAFQKLSTDLCSNQSVKSRLLCSLSGTSFGYTYRGNVGCWELLKRYIRSVAF